MGRSTEHYRKNKASRDKKKAYDAKLNAKPEQVKKRVEANRARRKAKAAGKDVRGKEYDHKSKRFIPSAKNEGRRGEGGRVKKKR